jgi:tripartite-type tricarboxylate transporter receptor subunit TctC
MKKFIFFTILIIFAITTQAQETIVIEFAAGSNQPNAVPYRKMIEIANSTQNKYKFVLEFKPGANGVMAIKTMDQDPQHRLATASPSFVENSRSGLINEDDYVAVSTQGSACWAVITNIGNSRKGISSLQGQKEITVGGTGYGNSAHLTALIIGKKYGFRVRYIVYRTNYDALVNMAAGEPINFVLERVSNYQTFATKNPQLQILGINCSQRNPQVPKVKTLYEQGFETPSIFISTIANKQMSKDQRLEIGNILDHAQEHIGLDYISATSDMFPPQFAKKHVTTQEFFDTKNLQMKVLTHQFEREINEAK